MLSKRTVLVPPVLGSSGLWSESALFLFFMTPFACPCPFVWVYPFEKPLVSEVAVVAVAAAAVVVVGVVVVEAV